MVGAGAHEGQAERDVDALLDAEVLDRDQPLVVRHRHDQVELARVAGGMARAHEHRVRRKRAAGVDALGARRAHRRRDEALLLVAEQPAFACMRVEAGHRDARPRLSPRRGRRVGDADRLQHRIETHQLDRAAQRHVDADQHHTQFVVGQHHAHRRRCGRRQARPGPAASRCGRGGRCRRRPAPPCAAARSPSPPPGRPAAAPPPSRCSMRPRRRSARRPGPRAVRPGPRAAPADAAPPARRAAPSPSRPARRSAPAAAATPAPARRVRSTAGSPTHHAVGGGALGHGLQR